MQALPKASEALMVSSELIAKLLQREDDAFELLNSGTRQTWPASVHESDAFTHTHTHTHTCMHSAASARDVSGQGKVI